MKKVLFKELELSISLSSPRPSRPVKLKIGEATQSVADQEEIKNLFPIHMDCLS